MNYYQACQREDGRWDYTRTNDGVTRPYGYCAGWVEYTKEDAMRLGEPELLRENDLTLPFKDKYHTDGHTTETEAVLCYRQYLLDQRLRLNKVLTTTQYQCRVCGAWTNLYAELDHTYHWPLCGQHNNLAVVENLYPNGTSWAASSW